LFVLFVVMFVVVLLAVVVLRSTDWSNRLKLGALEQLLFRRQGIPSHGTAWRRSSSSRRTWPKSEPERAGYDEK
jgi:hypothetical protein